MTTHKGTGRFVTTHDAAPNAEFTAVGHFTLGPVEQPTPPPTPEPDYGSLYVRNLTMNVQGTDPVAQVKGTVKGAIEAGHGNGHSVTLAGWQELPDGHVMDVLNVLGSGWAHYLPKTVTARRNAISWRRDTFDLVHTETIKLHGGQAHVTPSRYVNVAVLRHKVTGVELARVNTHIVHHIERGGHPHQYGGKYSKQLSRAKHSFAVLADTISRYSKHGPVIWGGDLNVNYLAERHLGSKRTPWFPYDTLGKVSHFAMPKRGTEGNRLIDWTGYAGRVRLIHAWRVSRGHSDHEGVVSSFHGAL